MATRNFKASTMTAPLGFWDGLGLRMDQVGSLAVPSQKLTLDSEPEDSKVGYVPNQKTRLILLILIGCAQVGP